MRVPLTTRDFLDRAELVYGDRIGIVDEPTQPAAPLGELTYREVARRGRAIAAGLDALGVGEGERVAVVSHNSARLLELLYAVPSFGRVLVPINFRLSPAEFAYIAEHSGASVLLADPEVEQQLAGIEVKHRFLLGEEYESGLLRFDAEPRPWTEPDEDATATINYTSGTTARPKGVQMTHRNIWVNATTFGMHMQVSDRDVYLHTLPMFHCNGWGLPYTSAGLGVRQVPIRKIDGAEILRRVEQHGVTLMAGAPAVWNAVLDAAADWDGPVPGRDQVRIVVAGAPPPSRTIARVEEELGWEFNQIYGLTETAPLLTINRPRAEYDQLSPEDRAKALSRAGVPALGTRMTVSESGEVLAQGNTVLAGYWENPGASAEALDGGWFHTGDGGTIDEGGYLTISDRKKDVIITGGENVSSIEVEDAVFSHPAVAEVAVIGVPDEKWGEMVTALVVLSEGQSVTEAELIAHTRERIAGYKAPKRVEFREAIPRTATGKIQKFKLRQAFWTDQGRQVN
ncbi:Acyl-CoA synthetase (AMP-forming)/AMP-acid ligase II [Modestobacter italicus]|uniref:Acyl-CoA synthetase (AMP-forming)/AMP-acid ligase II n=1 Tax=Modestobacter italicus (strain DSM 44449 / CECT 9708 / BC 501) TaxID=2732864 RepID=I4F035_MODI5|nr:AMP-binding protein [Modestobacter marinus]CCH88998.1 Acyl-CoA synthetase (AMP-forming)/AMP-acid ligase II [Modestobacter marinus]